MAVYWATPEDVCTDGWWIWSIFFGGVEKTWEVWESRMEKWNAQETEVELLEDNGFHDFLTERRHFFLVSISRRAVECCGQLWAGFLVTDKFMIFMMHWVCDKFVGPNSTGFFIIFPWALEVGVIEEVSLDESLEKLKLMPLGDPTAAGGWRARTTEISAFQWVSDWEN